MIIELTRGFVTHVDDSDYALVAQYTWCALVTGKTQYAVSGEPMIYMHRVIMNPPDHLLVDHIDDDGLNNRRSNLRIVTHAQNIQRAPMPLGESGYRGVSMNRN